MAEPGMEFQLIAGLGFAIFLLIFLVVKTKVTRSSRWSSPRPCRA